MPEYRVLLMDPMDASPDDVANAVQAIRNGLTAAAPHINVTCVLATEEKGRSFAQQGSWGAWCTWLATGVDYEQRTPLFNGVAIMDPIMGRATASIMEQALDAGRMGIYAHGGQIKQVIGVEIIDSEDWKGGWRASLKP